MFKNDMLALDLGIIKGFPNSDCVQSHTYKTSR